MSQLENQLTDEEVARQVQSGKIEAFGILVERYEAKMLRYARRFLFNFNDIEDLVQEVFIKVYVNIQSFNASRKFSTWLYRVAHNEFINALKKKSREPRFFLDVDTLFPHLAARQAADDTVQERELKEWLDRCLDKVDPKYREPLVLYYFEEMGYQEIAEVLRLPVSTVGVRLKRAKEALKKMCEKLN